jgi:hypothetical protein
MLISGADQRIYVYRNGIAIGAAPVRISDPSTPLTPAVYTLLQAPPGAPSPSTTGVRAQRWMRVDLPAQPTPAAASDFSQRVRLPKSFAAALNAELQPGATVMVTDRPASSETRSEPGFVVMQTAPPPTPAQ